MTLDFNKAYSFDGNDFITTNLELKSLLNNSIYFIIIR